MVAVTAEVGVGDKPDTEAVRYTGEVEPGLGDGLLNEGVESTPGSVGGGGLYYGVLSTGGAETVVDTCKVAQRWAW